MLAARITLLAERFRLPPEVKSALLQAVQEEDAERSVKPVLAFLGLS